MVYKVLWDKVQFKRYYNEKWDSRFIYSSKYRVPCQFWYLNLVHSYKKRDNVLIKLRAPIPGDLIYRINSLLHKTEMTLFGACCNNIKIFHFLRNCYPSLRFTTTYFLQKKADSTNRSTQKILDILLNPKYCILLHENLHIFKTF